MEKYDKKMERRSVWFFSILILSVLVFYFVKQDRLNKKGVFVIGHLVNSSFEGTEFGWIYDFEYYYDGKRFVKMFGSPMENYILNDSVMFIRVLPKTPDIYEKISVRVPKCLAIGNTPRLGWEQLPTCPTVESVQ